MKIFRISVNRPAKKGRDPLETRRSVLVLGESLDEAMRKSVVYYNDLDDVDDYFAQEIEILAGETEDEGAILLR